MRTEKESNKFNICTYLIEECNLQQGRKDKVAYYYKDETYTYGQLSEYINSFANYLEEKGLVQGQMIGMYMYDCPDFVFMFFGAIKAGIVPVLTNPKMAPEDVNKIIKKTNLTYLFTDQQLLENLPDELLNIAVNIDEERAEMRGKSKEYETKYVDKDDMAFVLFTSGSSGQPKGVIHSHYNMVEIINTFGKHVFETTENDVVYCNSKLSYALGLGSSTYLPMAQGASTVINAEEDIYSIVDIFIKHKVTIFIAVPSIFMSIVGLLEDNDNSLASGRRFVSGGEPISRKLLKAWKEITGIDITFCYGQTETLYLMTATGQGEEYYGTLGKPVPGFEIEVVRDDGTLAEPNEIANIVLKGKSFMLGYWDDPELTSSILKDDYMMSGDMGYYDENGMFWYSGRSTDTFKVNGAWQSALPLEELILQHENVVEVVVTNERNDERNSDIVAYMAVKDKKVCEDTVAEIKKMFFKEKKRTLCPKTFYFVESLPRGTTGKVKRGNVNQAKIYYTI